MKIKSSGRHAVKIFWLGAVFAVVLVMGFSGPAFCLNESGNYENSAVLNATQFFPPNILSGPEHRVEAKVKNDGFLNHYVLESTFGTYEVVSDTLLEKRVHEIYAIREMKKISTAGTAADSAISSGEKTVAGLKNLVSDPGDTLEGAGKGIFSIFDRTAEILTSPSTQSDSDRVEQLIGFSKSKRAIAAKLDVDVYSSNAVLQSELNRLAWADYLGGIGVSAALSVVPGAAGVVMSVSGGARLLNEAINMKSPTQLKLENRQKLNDMGMDPDTTELFLNNPAFTPRTQTFLVAALDKMGEGANRELFLKVALGENERIMALKMTQMAVMAAVYDTKETPIEHFYPIARVLYATDKKGKVLLFLPTDYILWSSRLAGALEEVRKKTRGERFELRTTGDVSRQCRDQLAKAGWSVHTHVLANIESK